MTPSYRRSAETSVLSTALSTALSLTMSAVGAHGRPQRVNHVPSGVDLGCQTCHFSPAGGAVNAFGYDVQLTLVGGEAQWEAVCQLDSDLDGYSNAVELGDEACAWRIGAGPAPDEGAIISYPGDPSSLPIEPPDLGLDMTLPDLAMDMALPVDQAIPDQEVWDAWLERPPVEDGFAVSPLDASPEPEDQLFTETDGSAGHLDMDIVAGAERAPDSIVELEEDLGTAGVMGGSVEVAGMNEGGGAQEPTGGELSKERALEDQLSGCQQPAHAPIGSFWLWVLGSVGLLRALWLRTVHPQA